MIKAEYVENKGDDLVAVNAARVSMDKESLEFTYRKDKEKGSDEGLLQYLAGHHHWTPYSHARHTFILASEELDYSKLTPELAMGLVIDYGEVMVKVRHSVFGWVKMIEAGMVPEKVCYGLSELCPESCKALGIYKDTRNVEAYGGLTYWPQEQEDNPRFIDVTMRETVPICISRQRYKHMVGFTYNEVSRRYVDDTPEFYVPDSWRSRPEASIKQGSGASMIKHLNDTRSVASAYASYIASAETLYNRMLQSDVAPEMARMVLPQSMLTSYWVTGSLHAWARAYKQRSDSHAQKEIQDLAVQWDGILKNLHPEQWQSLTNET